MDLQTLLEILNIIRSGQDTKLPDLKEYNPEYLSQLGLMILDSNLSTAEKYQYMGIFRHFFVGFLYPPQEKETDERTLEFMSRYWQLNGRFDIMKGAGVPFERYEHLVKEYLDILRTYLSRNESPDTRGPEMIALYGRRTELERQLVKEGFYEIDYQRM